MPNKKDFLGTPPLFSQSWETNGIFSDHFIRSQLKYSALWPSDEYTRPLYNYVSELWKTKYLGLTKGDEEIMKREFIEVLLERLGFAFLPFRKLPFSATRQVPDYLFFQSIEVKNKVFDLNLIDQYRAAICLLEAKKFAQPLSGISRREPSGRFPHQQIRDYLNDATDDLGNPFFKWAILTNGSIWRLYNRDSRASSFFQFRLADNLIFCTYDDFKIFITLFRPEAFIISDGICALDNVRNEAINYQTTIEENLRKRAFTVLESIANGFWSYKENNLTENDLVELYDNSLIFLYRLLFVLYAESNGLLPAHLYGPNSNKNYRERYSLQRYVGKLRQGISYQSDEFSDLYEQLLGLFHLINGDQPSRNRACNVPQYNGGLFDPIDCPRLEMWRMGEKSLANLLKDLIFSSGPSLRDPQPEIEWGTIDYADLEVRQLGDIYEGLLGGELVIIENRLALSEEYKKRQSSGTFYTPDYIVKYIVEQTLSPLIRDIEEMEEVKESVRDQQKNNCFAKHVLSLNILDPAMGSGHFLVRATEWLADKIIEHPTTKYRTHSPELDISPETAEIAYWRRRVVEACVYGVDYNYLAVELSKLSLWLICIASNEPLNFLDHHLRSGNSLVGVTLEKLGNLPNKKGGSQYSLSFAPKFKETIAEVIANINTIKSEESSKLESVKRKEYLWEKEVIDKILPFKQIGDVWVSASSGVEIGEVDYNKIANYLIYKNKGKGWKAFKEFWSLLNKKMTPIVREIKPLHWDLEFPDVFFEKNGIKKDNPGFDAIIGNPPYISTQSSSQFSYRNDLKFIFDFVDDLYVHFIFRGIEILRKGGRFGFIVSDTFFTLGSKQRLRELFQYYELESLMQCDPFKATVDAAVFILSKKESKEGSTLKFIQARYGNEISKPQAEIENITKAFPEIKDFAGDFNIDATNYPVYFARQGCLRLHRTSVIPYARSLKKAFYEPTAAVINLYNRFMEPVTGLVNKWWRRIETSKTFSNNREDIIEYHASLKEGDVTIVGLIAEGAQGMRTGNNGRFLGYLENTEHGGRILERREELDSFWKGHPAISKTYKELLEKNGGDFESVVEILKGEFDSSRVLGLKRGEIYRVVKSGNIADPYQWDEVKRKKVINEGLKGPKTWVPFKKGDPEGNKWIDAEPIYMNWSENNVEYLKRAPEARWQGTAFFFTEGITYTLLGNHTSLKAKIQPKCIFDAGASRLTPIYNKISPNCFLAIINSDLFSFIIKKFIKNTAAFEISDLRMAPIIIPNKNQAEYLEILSRKAIEAKEFGFRNIKPTKEIMELCSRVSDHQKHAPNYLQIPSQLKLISSANECVNIIELAIHWEVEKLYGVEGLGPFNEF